MPWNRYPEETIQKILDASLKLFLEKGYEQTSVFDIVENLGGLSRGAFYHHFKSKDEVVNVLMEKYFTENEPFEAVKNAEGLNGLGKIRKALGYIVSPENIGGIGKTAQSLLTLSNPRFLAELLKSNREVAPGLVLLIEEGMADGSIRPGNAALLAELLILLIHFWVFPEIFPGGKAVFDDKIAMIKQILDGLGFPVMDDEFMVKHEIWADLLNIRPASDAEGLPAQEP